MTCKNCNCDICTRSRIVKKPIYDLVLASYKWPDCCRWVTSSEIAVELGIYERDIYKAAREISKTLREFGVPYKRHNHGRYFYIPNLLTNKEDEK